LPQRIQEWGLTPCIAEEKNKKELEQIRKQQTDAREALEELDLKQKVEFYHSVKFTCMNLKNYVDTNAEIGRNNSKSETI
jgi:regulatory protein YycH of two-component signal transduction system YycFG